MEEQANHKGYRINDQFGDYFVTFTVVGWMDIFTRKECRHIIVESLKFCQKEKGLIIYAWVLMDSHLHMAVGAKEGSDGWSAIIRDFKKFTARKLIKWCTTSNKESRREWIDVVLKYHGRHKKEVEKYKFWKNRNRPIELLSPRFISQKINYIHNNPVAAEIVDRPEEYRYSSARNYVGRDDYLIEVEIIDFGVQEGFVMT